MGPDFDLGLMRVMPRIVEAVEVGRAATIHAAYHYTDDVLTETAQHGSAVGVLQPRAFLASTPSGVPVAEMYGTLTIHAKQAVSAGASVRQALDLVAKSSTRDTLTLMADTRREVYQADIIQRPAITGYTRMLNPPSCGRCAMLAGKWFRWNEGFDRHPRCDCIHIPASENVAGDLTTDPYAYFNSLSEKDQRKQFGKYESMAIRDGGDVYRVMNARQLQTAGNGMVKRGRRRVKTLEEIYTRDKDRRFIVENLRHHGYITGPQVAGGNIRGNVNTDASILALGRGRGTVRVGTDMVQTGRASRYDAALTGKRDPLNRKTMTEAERRVYDAHYRLMWAERGYRPNSVGANHADRGLGLRPITDQERSEAHQRWAVAQVVDARTPDSVRELIRLLTAN